MRTSLTISFLLLLVRFGFSQDPQFTQFYAAASYLNPAFAGATFQNRAVVNYRNQWPQVPHAFDSYNVAVDMNFQSINSGFGMIVTHDRAGTGGLKFTNAGFQFSHQFQVARDFYIRPAIQYAITTRSLDINALTFGDQLIRNNAPTSVESINYQNVTYFDFSSGFLAYSSTKWIGFSAHHINKPNESLLHGQAALPIKFSVHGGWKFSLENVGNHSTEDAITAAFNYKAQGKFDQLDIGFYYSHEPVIIGLWYRGIPLLKAYQPGYQNNDAVAILIGTEIKQLKIGYSYDITISRLVTNTSGAHEISITYQWAGKDAPPLSKQKRVVPCPKF